MGCCGGGHNNQHKMKNNRGHEMDHSAHGGHHVENNGLAKFAPLIGLIALAGIAFYF